MGSCGIVIVSLGLTWREADNLREQYDLTLCTGGKREVLVESVEDAGVLGLRGVC